MEHCDSIKHALLTSLDSFAFGDGLCERPNQSAGDTFRPGRDKVSSSTKQGVEAFSGRRNGCAPDVEDFIGGYGGSIVHSDEDHLLQC